MSDTGEISSIASSREQLERLREIAAGMPCDGESVLDDEAFQRNYGELEITLLGLEMLQARIMNELESGLLARVGAPMLKIKSAELERAIADLTLQVLGYYALPFPERVRGENEGSVGPEHALAAVRSWLASHSVGGEADTQHKNIIARVALDLQTG